MKGAVHPNVSNFRRVARLDVVARVRRLCEAKLLKERPPWLEWCERVPPMENHSLHLQAKTVRSPYPQMLNFLLLKYPDLRFQDCYVDGNDWSVGNDAYRADHPAMQFIARQLEFMRTENLSKKEAFAKTEELFRHRREELEREQKVMMAMALDAGLSPMFATGQAYLQAEKAKAEVAHLNKIRRELRDMRKDAEEKMAQASIAADLTLLFREGDAAFCRMAPPEGKKGEGAVFVQRPLRRCTVSAVSTDSVTVIFIGEDQTTRQLKVGHDDLEDIRPDRLKNERTRLAQAEAVRRSLFQEVKRDKPEPESKPDEEAIQAGPADEDFPGVDLPTQEEARRVVMSKEEVPELRPPATAATVPLDDDSFLFERRPARGVVPKKSADVGKMLSGEGVIGEDQDFLGDKDTRQSIRRAGLEDDDKDLDPNVVPTLRSGRRGGGRGSGGGGGSGGG